MGVARPTWLDEDLALAAGGSVDRARRPVAAHHQQSTSHSQQQLLQWTSDDSEQDLTRGLALPSAEVTNCNVVLLGDARVGKSSLISRVIFNKFSETYKKTVGDIEIPWNVSVASRKVRYRIWDTKGALPISPESDWVLKGPDVYLLCYDISSPASLSSALNCWLPEIRIHSPQTNVILVGCRADLRQNSYCAQQLVSTEEVLRASQQAGCALYVETDAKTGSRSAFSAFEVAALVTLGKLRPSTSATRLPLPPPIPPKPTRVSPPIPPKPRRAISTMALNKENLYSPDPHKELSLSRQVLNGTVSSSVSSGSGSTLSPKLSLKASRDRSSASLLSLTGSSAMERTVKIKCQRLNIESKEYEEVEVEVPAPVYETLRYYNEADRLRQKQREEGLRHGDLAAAEEIVAKNGKKSLTSKIRNLFSAKT